MLEAKDLSEPAKGRIDDLAMGGQPETDWRDQAAREGVVVRL